MAVSAVDVSGDSEVLLQVTADIWVVLPHSPQPLGPPGRIMSRIQRRPLLLARHLRSHPQTVGVAMTTSSTVTSTLVPTSRDTVERTRSAVSSTGEPQYRTTCTAQ